MKNLVFFGVGGNVSGSAYASGDQVGRDFHPACEHDFNLSASRLLDLLHDLVDLCYVVLEVGPQSTALLFQSSNSALIV